MHFVVSSGSPSWETILTFKYEKMKFKKDIGVKIFLKTNPSIRILNLRPFHYSSIEKAVEMDKYFNSEFKTMLIKLMSLSKIYFSWLHLDRSISVVQPKNVIINNLICQKYFQS